MIVLAILILLLSIVALLMAKHATKQGAGLRLGGNIGLVVGIGMALWSCMLTVPPGQAAVATLFGSVRKATYDPGFHVVNPLFEFTFYDVKDQTHKETASVPSQDKLTTDFDISLQYKIRPDATPMILNEIGSFDDVKEKHIIPKFRSAIREQGKTVAKADEFFNEEVQVRLQESIKSDLIAYLDERGVEVRAVLIRDIRLPQVLVQAVQAKKQREVEVERQQAELERFRIEQQQKVEQAQAELDAAIKEAEKVRTLADATAYEIEKVNEAIAGQPAYIQLQALEALKAISADGNSKIYFLNGDSPQPLPLMNIGDPVTPKP